MTSIYQRSRCTTRRASLAAIVLAVTIMGAGCNGSDTPTQPATGTVATITVSGPSTVRVGQTIRLTAAAFDSTGAAVGGQTFTWTSGNDAVASVASDGTVTGKVVGTASIIASVSVSMSGSANITVTP